MTIETFTVQLGAIRYTVDATDVDSAAWGALETPL